MIDFPLYETVISNIHMNTFLYLGGGIYDKRVPHQRHQDSEPGEQDQQTLLSPCLAVEDPTVLNCNRILIIMVTQRFVEEQVGHGKLLA